MTILNSKFQEEALNSISGYIKSGLYYDACNSLCKNYNSQIHIISTPSDELFDIKPVKSDSAINFQEFKDRVTTILTSLKSFNIDLGFTEPLFVRYFIRKLDNASLKYFYFVMDDLNIMPSMDKFVIFLEKGVSSP